MATLAQWRPFGYQVDWGSFPVWLGSFLTTGSVLLALWIILRDRRRDVRRQANQVSCFLSAASEVTVQKDGTQVHGKSEVFLYLYNASDDMIMAPNLLGKPKKNRPDLQMESAGLPERPVPGPVTAHDWVWRLRPNEDVVIHIETAAERDDYDWQLTFGDSASRVWIRDLGNYKLRRFRPPGKLRTKLKYLWLKYIKRRKFWEQPKPQ